MSILQFCLGSRHLVKKLERSRDKLYRIAFSWTHDQMLADDLVQDTLAKALVRLKQLKNQDVLEAWLISILSNLWRDYLRQHKDFIDIDNYIHLSSDDPEKLYETDRNSFLVRKAISQLPMGQRQVITLVDLEGLSYNEVSQVLEIPIGTVMSRLNRARKTMLDKLSADSRVVPLHTQQISGER